MIFFNGLTVIITHRMKESQYDALEKQLNSICTRILDIEQRLKVLHDKDVQFNQETKSPQFPYSSVSSHSATYKNSPFEYSVNKSPPVNPKIPKQCSGSCLIQPTCRIRLIPSTTRITLPSSDLSDDSDDYFSSDENSSKIVSTEEIHKYLPSNWTQLIERHNKEVEKLTFGKAGKITADDIGFYFQSMTQ
ncbi:hypothetical protein TRFO_21925 [Tritrichomonas foetus]|uniref:Uncharacterized protein n=1 Tax=Tritrichomonas foetus TaxID=1144522 RepID=A0A1J4KE33_9EUKA|nr:hypothetical protein TRFO_21925 [Tritrichomonas foetus]|eukprot:OHT09266.1 hypothetical protein TRFO_21925 [Tritrichomonas foetus]